MVGNAPPTPGSLDLQNRSCASLVKINSSMKTGSTARSATIGRVIVLTLPVYRSAKTSHAAGTSSVSVYLTFPQNILTGRSVAPRDRAYAAPHVAPATISVTKAVAPGAPRRRRQTYRAISIRMIAARNNGIVKGASGQRIRPTCRSGGGSLAFGVTHGSKSPMPRTGGRSETFPPDLQQPCGLILRPQHRSRPYVQIPVEPKRRAPCIRDPKRRLYPDPILSALRPQQVRFPP